MPNDESRVHGHQDNPIRLSRLALKDGFWEGDMVKIRMDYIPPKASRRGTLAPIPLNPDEGIGEESAFLYEPHRRIMLTQRNRHAVSTTMLGSYFYDKAHLKNILGIDPIIKREGLEKLRKMRVVRKFDISIARITNPHAFDNKGKTISSIIDTINHFGSRSARLVFSMGHFDGSLSLPTIVKTAVELSKSSNSEGIMFPNWKFKERTRKTYRINSTY